MMLELGSIGIPIALSLITTAATMIIVSKQYLVPLMIGIIDEKTKDTQNMMKAAASTMGNKSVEAREIKKMEKMMTGDIMEQYPELEIALEYFSPETAEMIKKHPDRALTLIARYKPILEQILGGDIEAKKNPWDY